MPASGRELVGWTEERWAAVQEAAGRALARTAKCQQIVPKGPHQIGAKAVVVPNIAVGPRLSYGPDTIATPVHIYVDIQLDDQHIDDDAAVHRLVEAGASQLGVLEDQEIIQGAPARGRAAAGRTARNPALPRSSIGRAPGVAAGGTGTTKIAASGAVPTGQELMTALTTAVANLETGGRSGSCGLLLHNRLLAVLRVPPVAGAAPLIQQVEQLIDSSKIAGTSALEGTMVAGDLCGVLFRLDPAAVDLVYTQKPTVTVLGRAAGQSDLRIEEDLVVRVMDQAAVHHLEY